MSPRSPLIFAASVFCCLCYVRGDINEFNDESVIYLLPQKIGEQIHQLFSLQFRPLGNTPLELGLKVVLNALEIFAIASGTRLFAQKTGLDEATESIYQDHYTTILASANLCANLSTLREMHYAIVNAALFVGAEMVLDPSGVVANKAPERLYDILDKFASVDPELKTVYWEEKRKIRAAEWLPPLAEGAIDFERIVPLQVLPELFDLFDNYPRFRYFLVNALFALWTSESLANGSESLREHHELATSLVTLSIESKNPNEAQKLFGEAILRTAAKLDPANINLATIMQIGESLSSALRKVLQKIRLEDENIVSHRY